MYVLLARPFYADRYYEPNPNNRGTPVVLPDELQAILPSDAVECDEKGRPLDGSQPWRRRPMTSRRRPGSSLPEMQAQFNSDPELDAANARIKELEAQLATAKLVQAKPPAPTPTDGEPVSVTKNKKKPSDETENEQL